MRHTIARAHGRKWKLHLLLGVSAIMQFTAVSSASITAVNPDKSISVDGEKTFPVGMQAISSRFYEYNVDPPLVTPFDPSQNAEFLFDSGADSYGYVDDAYWQSVIPKYAAYEIYWTVSAESAQNTLQTLPYFFGYYQKDEPTPGIGFPASYTYQDVADDLAVVYANAKAADPNHVVVLTHWTKMLTWVPCADVMSWDCYTIMSTSDPATGELLWQRTDSIYAWEHESSGSYLEGHDVNDISKPVWTVIQANGVEMPLDAWRTLYVPTPAEVRANVYTALTLDIKGISFWGYKSWGEESATATYPHGTSGLYNNPALHAYYRQLAAELRSFNHILVLPTVAYSWEYKRDTTHVTFSSSLTRNVLWKDRTNFNYLLKQEGDDTYLFAVNKDTQAIENVDITVAGLSGAMTATSLGLETSGSQRAGRTLSVIDGKFTDSFDGYAAHIYRISRPVPPSPDTPDDTEDTDDTDNTGETADNAPVVYPNPFKKSKGTGSTLNFRNMGMNAVVKIYSINGELVYEINCGADGASTWDASGVSSGVYFYVAKTPDSVRKGKLAVIK